MSIAVIKPGMLTTVQDLGRTGYQHLGVPVGGAMDSRAHRLANMLAGNAIDAATLEMTFGGPTLRFDEAACFALGGASLGAKLNDKRVPNYRPLIARAGDVLSFGKREAGLRAYLAVHGGFDVPVVMDSRSTYLRGGFGGHEGRALRAGDTLAIDRAGAAPGKKLGEAALKALARELWEVEVYLPAPLALQPRAALRLIAGVHAHLFTEEALAALHSASFTISPDSDRMGYRLKGPTLAFREPVQLLSEAMTNGSIQVPADGQPIVLMADRQTVGGYAKIGHVASVDLPLIAQSMPGETLRFEAITVEHAQALDSAREAAYLKLEQALTPLRKALAAW